MSGILDFINSVSNSWLNPAKKLAEQYVSGVDQRASQAATQYSAPKQPSPTKIPTPTNTPIPTPTPSPSVSPTIKGSSNLPGYVNGTIPNTYLPTILDAAKRTGIHPALLAAVLMSESGFNPQAQNADDYGIAQINLPSHPTITKQQAYDPNFAINFMADYLSNQNKSLKDINQAVASYNVGGRVGKAPGRDAMGLGPKGRQYLNRVVRNLSPEVLQQLGLKSSY